MRFATTVKGLLVAGVIAAMLPTAFSLAQQTPAPETAPAAAPAAPTAPQAPRPGQTPEVVSPATPTGVEIGMIHWFPAQTHCRFFTPERQAAFVDDDPLSWQFVFITMLQASDASEAPLLERGYVMANGLLREMEKARAAPDSTGNIVTVWRSAGEPRINVNMALEDPANSADPSARQGSMTLFWGDKKSTVEVVGDCAA